MMEQWQVSRDNASWSNIAVEQVNEWMSKGWSLRLLGDGDTISFVQGWATKEKPQAGWEDLTEVALSTGKFLGAAVSSAREQVARDRAREIRENAIANALGMFILSIHTFVKVEEAKEKRRLDAIEAERRYREQQERWEHEERRWREAQQQERFFRALRDQEGAIVNGIINFIIAARDWVPPPSPPSRWNQLEID